MHIYVTCLSRRLLYNLAPSVKSSGQTPATPACCSQLSSQRRGWTASSCTDFFKWLSGLH